MFEPLEFANKVLPLVTYINKNQIVFDLNFRSNKF